MSWYDFILPNNRVDEKIKAFKNKDEEAKLTISDYKNKSGEGISDLMMLQMGGGFGATGIGSFNNFYNSYINRAFENEYMRIIEYRKMADYPEISDVIEDACNEMCDTDSDENVMYMDITDEKIAKNENISSLLYKEFKTLFYDRIDINDVLWDWFRTYLIDGRLYYERIIDVNNKGKGILNVKKLPTETMDFEYEPKTGRIMSYYQYLVPNYRRPVDRNAAERDMANNKLIIFEPAQIGFINYGIYGQTKLNILGYLEKARVPYNQLKLLETSVIIYRLIRSPERLVFKIDTGAMPKDRALKFVEKIKNSFIKKQSYNPQTGALTNEPEVFCIKHDTEIPLLDGRFLTLDQLVKEHSEGKENWVYSVNQKTLNIEPGKIKNAMITRLNTNMVRVHTDDGNYIDCTPDHKFVLRDGSECMAGELKEGTALMPMYTRNGYIGTYKSEYQQFYRPSDGKWIFTHRMVAKHMNGDYTGVVHHKNFNRFDNSPNNLQVMTFEEHSHMHGENIKNMFKNPEYRKKHSEWTIRTNKEQDKAKKMQAVLNTPEVREYQKKRAKESRDEYWSDKTNIDSIKQRKTYLFDETALYMMCEHYEDNRGCKRDYLIDSLNNDKVFLSYLEELNKDQDINNKQFDHINKQVLWKMIGQLGYKDYPDFRDNYAGYKNHKVTKVEVLDEKADCGCLEVEGNHNFAVSRNKTLLFIVKNSILENYFLPQCLSLNTKIFLADGRNLTLNQIIQEHNEGKVNNVLSIDQDAGVISTHEIEWAGITRKNAELIRVYLENDEYIDCTPDHKILVWADETKIDMIEVEAQHLTEDMDIVEFKKP